MVQAGLTNKDEKDKRDEQNEKCKCISFCIFQSTLPEEEKDKNNPCNKMCTNGTNMRRENFCELYKDSIEECPEYLRGCDYDHCFERNSNQRGGGTTCPVESKYISSDPLPHHTLTISGASKVSDDSFWEKLNQQFAARNHSEAKSMRNSEVNTRGPLLTDLKDDRYDENEKTSSFSLPFFGRGSASQSIDSEATLLQGTFIIDGRINDNVRGTRAGDTH